MYLCWAEPQVRLELERQLQVAKEASENQINARLKEAATDAQSSLNQSGENIKAAIADLQSANLTQAQQLADQRTAATEIQGSLRDGAEGMTGAARAITASASGLSSAVGDWQFMLGKADDVAKVLSKYGAMTGGLFPGVGSDLMGKEQPQRAEFLGASTTQEPPAEITNLKPQFEAGKRLIEEAGASLKNSITEAAGTLDQSGEKLKESLSLGATNAKEAIAEGSASVRASAGALEGASSGLSSAARQVSNAASQVNAAAIAAAAARAAIRPRLKGGPVKPGELYLGGERRPELLKFNDGRAEVIGQSGPELFTVDKPGIVHPTVPSGFPKIEVALPRPKGSNGGAELLNEMRALRRDLQAKGPNAATYNIVGAQDPVGATLKLQAEQLRQQVRMRGL